MSPGQVSTHFDVYSRKKPWEVLQASILMHKVHPPSEAVSADHGVWSLGTPPEINNVESPIIKEEVSTKADY